MKRKLVSAGLLLAVLLTTLVAPAAADGRNQPPVAVPDFALTSPYDPVAIANVLANDWDPNGDGIFLIGIRATEYGSALMKPEAGLVYFTFAKDAPKDAVGIVVYEIRDSYGAAAQGVLTIYRPQWCCSA
ncbi:MAG: Ig-like domain-containing protein [Caldilineales bacterium]